MFQNLLGHLLAVAALAVLAFVAVLLWMALSRRGRGRLLGTDADPLLSLGKDHPYGVLILHIAVMLAAAYFAWRAIISKQILHHTEAGDPAQFWFDWALLPLFEIFAGRNLIIRFRSLFGNQAGSRDTRP